LDTNWLYPQKTGIKKWNLYYDKIISIVVIPKGDKKLREIVDTLKASNDEGE
jgi:hypothetical protein